MARKGVLVARLAAMVAAALLALAGCGVGGGGGSSVTPPSIDLTGSYDLFAFDIYYYATSVATPLPVRHLTEFDYSTFFGTLSLNLPTPAAGTISQVVDRNGIRVVDFAGSLDLIILPDIYTVTPALGSPFNLTVTPVGGFDLDTQTQLFFDPGTGLWYTELDHWSKFSDVP